MSLQRGPDWQWSDPERRAEEQGADCQAEAVARMLRDHDRIPVNGRAPTATPAGEIPATTMPSHYVVEALASGYNRLSDLGTEV